MGPFYSKFWEIWGNLRKVLTRWALVSRVIYHGIRQKSRKTVKKEEVGRKLAQILNLFKREKTFAVREGEEKGRDCGRYQMNASFLTTCLHSQFAYYFFFNFHLYTNNIISAVLSKFNFLSSPMINFVYCL